MSRGRYPSFKRDATGKPICRGCSAPIPKGRQTWCSDTCYRDHCPQVVNRQVLEKSKGICARCGIPAQYLREAYRRLLYGPAHGWIYRGLGWDTLPGQDRIHAARRKAGWPGLHRAWWEFDHIIPHSQGGQHTTGNIRLLCVRCHRQVTAEQTSARAAVKRAAQAAAAPQLPLSLLAV